MHEVYCQAHRKDLLALKKEGKLLGLDEQSNGTGDL